MTPSSVVEDQKALMVGISGCSSSGKTTLSRLLRDLFPHTFILHEDDFYRPESEIPVNHGHDDWDCPEALDIALMAQGLQHIRSHGELPVSLSGPRKGRVNHGMPKKGVRYLPEHPQSTAENITSGRTSEKQAVDTTPEDSPHPLPRLLTPDIQPTLNSKEDLNSIGVVPIRESYLNEMSRHVKAWLTTLPQNVETPRICITDGFLLYTPKLGPVPSFFDLRLFLLTSKQKATERRVGRDGYVTVEGFWKDPPGYMDTIVWPNYAAAHGWMFKDGDVEGGVVDPVKLDEKGVTAQADKGVDVDMETTLKWAVGQVMSLVEEFMRRG